MGETPRQISPGNHQRPVESQTADLTTPPRFRLPAAATAADATVARQNKEKLKRWLGPLADPATWQAGLTTGGHLASTNQVNWQRQGSLQAAGREIQADVKIITALQKPLTQEQRDAILKVVKGEIIRGFFPLRVRTFSPPAAFKSRARELRKDLDSVRDLANNRIRQATPDNETGMTRSPQAGAIPATIPPPILA